MYSHWIVQLLSHVPPMNDIGRQRSGGGADKTFDGADTITAARDKVPVSLSFDITPPMDTALIVIVIILPSLVDHCRRCPHPPPPAQTSILERKTRPREATRTTTTARNQSHMGHCGRRVKDNQHQSPPHWPLSSISGAIRATCQSWGGGGRLMRVLGANPSLHPQHEKQHPLFFFSTVCVTAPLALPQGSSKGS